VRVVCVGAGWVTRERHLPALARDARVEVLGVVDVHPERAAAVAAAAGVASSGTSLDEAWAAGAEAVTIGAPPAAHAELVAAALERGLHCLCEKPLTLDPEAAAAAVARAEADGLVLAVVHNFQFSRSGTRLFDLVEGGRLGRIESVHGFQLSNPRRRLPAWHGDLRGGLFADEAPHLLYLLRRLLGELEPRAVDARLDGRAIRDLTATFDHPEIWATLSMGFGASLSEWQLVVVGERAVAALDVFRDVLVVLPNDGSHRGREILRTSGALAGRHVAGVAASGARLVSRRLLYGNDEVVTRFVDAVEGRPERLRHLTGADGLAVVRCLDELLGRAGL
jgi:scyllo-inositol 2-dehydrogenase (NADP+)